jgi:uncharacterized LabA/DUF88 family protein
MYPPGPNSQTSYLFIDGASFQGALTDISERFFDGEILQVNWKALRGSHLKVFYYDALPVQQMNEDLSVYSERIAPKQTELAAIERQAGYHVKTGDVQRRRTRGNEQKMVDVQLAVDALQAASRGLYSQCAFITGDLDFRPLVAALVDMGIDVTLHYPPGHTSNELLVAADNTIPIVVTSAASYLDLTDAQKNMVPSAYSDHQTLESPPKSAYAVWDDPNHGQCFAVEDGEYVKLVTERCPFNPKSHRLVVRARTREHLTYYAEQSRGISIPT